MAVNTGYILPNGTDLGSQLVEKSYLIDRYPELVDTFRFAGLWAWGDNINIGQLGDNTVASKSSPIQTIAGGTNWKQVSTGGYTVGSIKTDGTLWLWGKNHVGQLGDNTNVNKSSPVQTIAGGTNWKQVACGYTITAAIKTDGTLWTWGSNFYGQLGDNTTTGAGFLKSSPVQTVSGGTNWKQASANSASVYAIKTDGTLWVWGLNNQGQLGDNTTASKASPVQTIAAGTNWKQVASGYQQCAAIKTDGTLWLWGYNNNGELGDNTRVAKSSPVQTISGGTNWKQVSINKNGAAAIKTDATLWGWGSGFAGKLGEGFVVNRSSPVQTMAGGTNWKQVACGYYHTIAIKTDGTLWGWGSNTLGELADSTRTNKSSPVQTVAGGTNWKQVSCSGQHTLAIRDNSSDIFGNSI